MPRYLSFRFDDGFLTGARRVHDLLGPDRASFFIISGLVEKTHKLEHIPLFQGREFGTLVDWKALSQAGHDIQPHSVTHSKFPELTRSEQIAEVTGSLDLVRRIHDGPYVFCHPYNLLSDLDFAALGLDAAGFGGGICNDLDALDRYRLKAYLPLETCYDELMAQLRTVPEAGWSILAFHSLDGEGHKPWSSECFARLVAEVRQMDFTIEPVSAILARARAGGR